MRNNDKKPYLRTLSVGSSSLGHKFRNTCMLIHILSFGPIVSYQSQPAAADGFPFPEPGSWQWEVFPSHCHLTSSGVLWLSEFSLCYFPYNWSYNTKHLELTVFIWCYINKNKLNWINHKNNYNILCGDWAQLLKTDIKVYN